MVSVQVEYGTRFEDSEFGGFDNFSLNQAISSTREIKIVIPSLHNLKLSNFDTYIYFLMDK